MTFLVSFNLWNQSYWKIKKKQPIIRTCSTFP